MSFPLAHRLNLVISGPEDVVVDKSGRLICGVKGGTILRIDPDIGNQQVIGQTGGRPLELELLPDGLFLPPLVSQFWLEFKPP